MSELEEDSGHGWMFIKFLEGVGRGGGTGGLLFLGVGFSFILVLVSLLRF